MDFKKCPVCGQVKPLSDFPVYFSKARQKNRVGNYCKPCGREKAKIRANKYYRDNTEKCKKNAKEYRNRPENKSKIREAKNNFRRQYRKNLKGCYVRELLVSRHGFDNKDLLENPEIVELHKLNLKLKRKMYGKE